MTSVRLILLLILLLLLAACSSHEPVWRMKAKLALLQLHSSNAETTNPDDYDHVNELFCQGEALLGEPGSAEQADELFKNSYQKGSILLKELQLIMERQKEEALQKEIDARALRDEELRIQQEAELIRQQEQQEAAHKALQKKLHEAADAEQTLRAAQTATSYSVRRGETLPQIAARPEIYNDTALWPIIYRANRDQVRDPYQLWPGQILKIPRGFSKDEAVEARRQSYRRGIK